MLDIKNIVKQVIVEESKAIMHLADLVTDDFVSVINLIYDCKGRFVVTGIGKSAIIGQKLVATLNSTGTPSVFMHAAEAIHGDLGYVQNGDVVLFISNSGNSPEIKALVPYVQKMGNSIVSITGNLESFLGENSDFVLNSFVEKEACPNNLAPTSSTTAQLVLCDAIAVALIEKRNFGSEDFAKYHPGGSLGKKLYLRVEDIVAINSKPKVSLETSIKETIMVISKNRLGVTAVVDANDQLLGIITDGDLRRMLESNVDFSSLCAKDIMGINPSTISSYELASSALQKMESKDITQLLVVDDNKYSGVVHLHDILKEGIV